MNIKRDGADNGAPMHKLRTDRHLWGTYIVLVLLASVELFSASIQEVNNNVFAPLLRHGLFLFVGLLIMLFLQRIHYRHIYNFIPLYVIGCLGMMVAVHFAGSAGSINDAQRAFKIAGVTVLPADALKLAVALGIAWILSRTQKKLRDGRHDVTTTGLVCCILFLGLCAGMLFEHGLSNTIIVCAIGFATMFVGGMSMKKIAVAVAVFGLVGGGAMYYKTQRPVDLEEQQRSDRIAELNMTAPADSVKLGQGRGSVWIQRWNTHWRRNKHLEEFSTEKQQEQLSYIAQAHGGFFGVGVGKSRENARLPLAHSDYIYAIIVEELGALVAIVILSAYLWILGRAAKLTMSFKQTLPSVLAMACAFTIVFQALYHIAIVVGVFPVSGQPLPLFSRGGMSVLTTSIAFGIMLSVARHAVRITDTRADAKQETAILPDSAVSDNPAMVDIDHK